MRVCTVYTTLDKLNGYGTGWYRPSVPGWTVALKYCPLIDTGCVVMVNVAAESMGSKCWQEKKEDAKM